MSVPWVLLLSFCCLRCSAGHCVLTHEGPVSTCASHLQVHDKWTNDIKARGIPLTVGLDPVLHVMTNEAEVCASAPQRAEERWSGEPVFCSNKRKPPSFTRPPPPPAAAFFVAPSPGLFFRNEMFLFVCSTQSS